ncbi:molybdopterin-binding protein [Nocardioides endophyticus]
MGLDAIDVRRVPSVSAVITGAEVVSHGVPHENQVRDAVGPMLPGMVASAGGRFRDLVPIGDQARLLEEHLAARVDDIVLVTGASSAGPSDFLAPTLTSLGARQIVDSVGCRPGHPQSLWEWGDSFVVGLPGNPLAALAAFVTLAMPLLDRMGGRPLRGLEPHGVHRDFEDALRRSSAKRGQAATVLSPCRLTGGLLTSVGHDGSAMLRGSVNATGFAVTGPGVVGIAFHPFPWSLATP